MRAFVLDAESVERDLSSDNLQAVPFSNAPHIRKSPLGSSAARPGKT